MKNSDKCFSALLFNGHLSIARDLKEASNIKDRNKTCEGKRKEKK